MGNEKCFEDAFKNAEPKVDGMNTEQFADMVADKFKAEFPVTMTSFEQAYGHEKAMKIAHMMIIDGDIFTLCKCFFMSGYYERIHDEKKGGPDHA